jgi:type I restriction enzyme, S subunit
MNELPTGWAECRLKDIVSVLDNQRVPVNLDERSKRLGTVPYYGATGQVGWIDNFLFDEELLLIGEDGAPFFDKTKPISYIICGKTWVNNHAHVLRAIDDVTSNLYLKYYLDQFDFQEFVNGTTRLKLTQGSMNEIPVKLAPLNEQRRIVAKLERLLSRVDAAQARLETIPLILKRLRESVLAAACSGHLTADWREQNKRIFPAELQIKDNGFNLTVSEDDLETLPATWKWVPLGNYGKCSRGRFSIRPRNDPRYFGGEYPFIQIGNLPREGGLITSHDQTLNEMGLGVSKCFPKGTVVIAIVGATIGNTGILSYDMCFTDSMVGIETGSDIGNVYVELFLRSRKDHIRQSSYAGGGQPNIKLETLNPFPLALPPFPEQQEIVRRVGALFKTADALEARYRKAKAYVDKLTQSILAKAFRGELVPQDPNDEPASALLKRIKIQNTP